MSRQNRLRRSYYLLTMALFSIHVPDAFGMTPQNFLRTATRWVRENRTLLESGELPAARRWSVNLEAPAGEMDCQTLEVTPVTGWSVTRRVSRRGHATNRFQVIAIDAAVIAASAEPVSVLQRECSVVDLRGVESEGLDRDSLFPTTDRVEPEIVAMRDIDLSELERAVSERQERARSEMEDWRPSSETFPRFREMFERIVTSYCEGRMRHRLAESSVPISAAYVPTALVFEAINVSWSVARGRWHPAGGFGGLSYPAGYSSDTIHYEYDVQARYPAFVTCQADYSGETPVFNPVID